MSHFSEFKMLTIFKAMEVYLAVVSVIFVAVAFVVTVIDSKLERLNTWSRTFPGVLALTAFGCAIAATMVIVGVLGLANISCQEPLYPAPNYQSPPSIASQ